jgi:hypothetical protein
MEVASIRGITEATGLPGWARERYGHLRERQPVQRDLLTADRPVRVAR